jgi:hypothetical protein
MWWGISWESSNPVWSNPCIFSRWKSIKLNYLKMWVSIHFGNRTLHLPVHTSLRSRWAELPAVLTCQPTTGCINTSDKVPSRACCCSRCTMSVYCFHRCPSHPTCTTDNQLHVLWSQVILRQGASHTLLHTSFCQWYSETLRKYLRPSGHSQVTNISANTIQCTALPQLHTGLQYILHDYTVCLQF